MCKKPFCHGCDACTPRLVTHNVPEPEPDGWEAEFEKFIVPRNHWSALSLFYKEYTRQFWSGPTTSPDAIKSFIRRVRAEAVEEGRLREHEAAAKQSKE